MTPAPLRRPEPIASNTSQVSKAAKSTSGMPWKAPGSLAATSNASSSVSMSRNTSSPRVSASIAPSDLRPIRFITGYHIRPSATGMTPT